IQRIRTFDVHATALQVFERDSPESSVAYVAGRMGTSSALVQHMRPAVLTYRQRPAEEGQPAVGLDYRRYLLELAMGTEKALQRLGARFRYGEQCPNGIEESGLEGPIAQLENPSRSVCLDQRLQHVLGRHPIDLKGAVVLVIVRVTHAHDPLPSEPAST